MDRCRQRMSCGIPLSPVRRPRVGSGQGLQLAGSCCPRPLEQPSRRLRTTEPEPDRREGNRRAGRTRRAGCTRRSGGAGGAWSARQRDGGFDGFRDRPAGGAGVFAGAVVTGAVVVARAVVVAGVVVVGGVSARRRGSDRGRAGEIPTGRGSFSLRICCQRGLRPLGGALRRAPVQRRTSLRRRPAAPGCLLSLRRGLSLRGRLTLGCGVALGRRARGWRLAP